MRASKEELPLTADHGEGFIARQVEWGGMIVEISSFPAGLDASPIFKGLPDDRCQAPHWGYVLKGRARMRYKDHEEVIEAGEVYYLEPGHLPLFEEDTELVMFSPKREYEMTIEVVDRNVAAMEESQ